MKFSELQRKLEKNGWYIERSKKHLIYVHPEKPGIKIPIGKHGTKEVPFGTLKSILKEAGLE
ncbi:MAG TPA: type II toxin-antitoxin system HicA family toxin [Hanamia sp.]|jgi:predicted RNA binding protein YcfA (HicA-like mRNA interferase family)|nr:type II toxin-antitoxin system HicA family toxin [Hanamia sp.]